METEQKQWPFGTTPEGVIRERHKAFCAAYGPESDDLYDHANIAWVAAVETDDLLTVLGMLALGGSRGALVCRLIEREGAEDARRLRIEILAALGIKEG